MFLPGFDAPSATGGASPAQSHMIDPYGRAVSYLRLSVTDRCDCRCIYCMPERMTFLPKRDLLSLEELDRLCSVFIKLGARKIRLTGGKPLVRRDLMVLIRSLSRRLHAGALDELTLTTNGSQLARFADELADCGVKRINVSLDTLDADKFRAISRRGDLGRVLVGLDAADRAGMKVKINVVALRGVNEAEAPRLVEWAHGRGYDLTFIEVMPLGGVEGERLGQHVPLTELRSSLRSAGPWRLRPIGAVAPPGTSGSARPAAGSVSSRRSRIVSARAAIASA